MLNFHAKVMFLFHYSFFQSVKERASREQWQIMLAWICGLPRRSRCSVKNAISFQAAAQAACACIFSMRWQTGKRKPPASCGCSQRAGGIMEYYMFCLWGYSFHNGSSCQFAGKPLALIIVWGLSRSNAMTFSLKLLFGWMLCSKYAKQQSWA